MPAATLRTVRTWLRRLRRCLRFAQMGNHSMARRLRPPDLWLPHARHSVAATAAWDWDLRPLEHGGDAVPLAPSGVGDCLPAGASGDAAVREYILAAAVSFGDRSIVSELLQGIRDDARCQRGTLLCAPHGGALRHFEQAAAKLAKTEQRGWGCSHAELPCWPIRASPYSVVDESERAGKPKFRLTNDLSWPHAGAMSDGDGVRRVDQQLDGARAVAY